MLLKWKGKSNGRSVEGRVQAGAAFGPLEVTSQLEALVSAGARVSEGPRSGPADLSDPLLARAAVRACLDPGTVEFEGPEAQVDAVPEGAVA